MRQTITGHPTDLPHKLVLMRATNSSGRTVIGGPANFWLFDEQDGFDLTHPSDPDAPPVYPRMTLQTSKTPVTLAPRQTALVVIDMQNLFLSSAMGRPKGPGHAAEEALLTKGIPAARRAGIRILWLNWGIADERLQTMPPLFIRNFGFSFQRPAGASDLDSNIKQEWRHTEKGIGLPWGKVTLDDSSTVDAGRLLMRDQWNTELYGGLVGAYEEGLHLTPADVKFHKESYSGFRGGNTEFAEYLKSEGIRSLIFSGVNTDQCVLGTLMDAAHQGYDTIMLQDACGTASPGFAQETVEFNAERALGFRSSCDDLLKAAEHIDYSGSNSE